MLGNKKPRRLHTFMEGRAALETLAHFGTMPLHRYLPRGDGHPVLIIPAFMTTDRFTAQFRRCLTRLGYTAYPWQQGVNAGLNNDKLGVLEAQLKALADRHGEPVSVIGWSLGGLYARSLANLHPDRVRQVITLGSPFGIPTMQMQGVQSGVARLYSLFNRMDDPMLGRTELWQRTPEVPFTGVYTESDGIIHWHYCLDRRSERSENIRVLGSHVGLTHNPLVLNLISDRLRYRAEGWQPFAISGWKKPFYATTCASDVCDPADLAAIAAPV